MGGVSCDVRFSQLLWRFRFGLIFNPLLLGHTFLSVPACNKVWVQGVWTSPPPPATSRHHPPPPTLRNGGQEPHVLRVSARTDVIPGKDCEGKVQKSKTENAAATSIARQPTCIWEGAKSSIWRLCDLEGSAWLRARQMIQHSESNLEDGHLYGSCRAACPCGHSCIAWISATKTLSRLEKSTTLLAREMRTSDAKTCWQR